jgi:hypothetical protein
VSFSKILRKISREVIVICPKKLIKNTFREARDLDGVVMSVLTSVYRF